MSFNAVDLTIIGPAFLAGAVVLATHVPLGQQVLLANNPHGGELRDLLVGQILWVDWRGLGVAAALSALVLGGWRPVMRRLGRPGFHVLFAVSVTVSVQLVGVYLVFAGLIVPALATRELNVRTVPVGYAIGLVGYLLGLLLSTMFDGRLCRGQPTGASRVLLVSSSWSLLDVDARPGTAQP